MATTNEAASRKRTRDAFRRIRGGVATADDLRIAGEWEARAAETARAQRVAVRSVWDLPIARRMWEADARDVEVAS